MKDQIGFWLVEAFLVTLVIVGVFGALEAPHYVVSWAVPWGYWYSCSVIFWPLANYRTVANDIRLGGPYRPSFAAALNGAKAAAAWAASYAGLGFIALVLLWFLKMLLFHPGALLRIHTYKDPAFFLLKGVLGSAVLGSAFVASIALVASIMGKRVFEKSHKPIDLPDTATPGQGLSFSLRNAALSGVVAVVSVFLLFAVNSRNDLYRSWPDVTFLSLFFGVLAASGNGGFDAIKHLTLRFLLRRQNLIPRDLVAFLEHATKLVFLRKIGPGYIFIHRLLLENFAGIQPSFETTPMVSGDERRAERLPEETRRVAERQEAPLTSSTRSLAEECFVEGERYRRVKDYGKARERYQKAADAGLAQAKQALSLLRLKRLFGFWSLRRRPRSGRR